MTALPVLDYLTLTYRADLDVLTARWLHHPTETELQAGYDALLEAAARHGCHYWLVDVRRRNHANQQATPWMMASFFPRIASRLPGKPVFLAYLFQPTHLLDLEADATVPGLEYFEGRPYRVARFSEEQAAMAWLAATQSR